MSNLRESIDWRRASIDAIIKLHPKRMIKNPVMFVVEVGSVLTTLLWLQAIFAPVTSAETTVSSTVTTTVSSTVSNIATNANSPLFLGVLSVWLWFTILFANFAEALAESRGKARADALRQARQDVQAKRIKELNSEKPETSSCESISSSQLRKGDLVLIVAGELIPSDGDVIEGMASVDESAITGESAPVIRESGGDRSAVTGGTRVLSDWLVVKISANAGETFLDRMIGMVEGAKRSKTPNEIALDILLAALTLIFLLATVTLQPFSVYAAELGNPETTSEPVSIAVLVALLVCLIPTTIGGLLSAIGIAGMDRLLSANVIATSGRAVEAAGDVDVLLLDKTGTITHGNRQASAFLPASGVREANLAEAAMLASLADETPEGRSIVVLAKERLGSIEQPQKNNNLRFVPFTAQTRMSGVDVVKPNKANGEQIERSIRKGALDAIERYLKEKNASVSDAVRTNVANIARQGATPLVVAEGTRVLGVIALKDIVKSGIREKFSELRRMGILTVMITGDNPLTAAAIAAEAGVDDFIAEATPQTKLERIRSYQNAGHLVAMTGDGTNDAPALAQADVAVAMNTGTQVAKEAGNMVDLDSSPTKLIRIVEIGKQMLMTRGALTTFSIANDISKYFVIVPAAFASTYPVLQHLDILHMHSPITAILSAVIFNALIIVALIPLALRGVPYRAAPADVILQRHLLIYGLGGVIVPFPCIKLIDMFLAVLVA